MRRHLRGLAPMMVALLLATRRGPADAQQQVVSVPAQSIVGIVRDSGGIPIDSAEVRIASLQRRTFSDADGLFRFDGVRAGRYDVSVRRLGFAPQVRRVSVGRDHGGSATFALVPVRYALPPVVVSSPRGGLSGIIGDTGFNVLRGAAVYVMGSGKRAVTDSAGTFFLDVEPGRYMVDVTTAGFARKLLSVTIPEDSGRHVTVWLVPSRRPDHRRSEVLESLRLRMMLRRATARLYTREELSRFKMEWLRQLLVLGTGMPVAEDCQALVDGLWRRPVYNVTLDEAESVEVYPAGSLATPDGTLLRSRPIRIDPQTAEWFASSPACPTVYVWTRG